MSDPTRLRDVVLSWYERGDIRFAASLTGDAQMAEDFVEELLAALSTTPAPAPLRAAWDDGYDAGVLQGLSISGIPQADIDRLWDEHRQKVAPHE